MTFTTADKHVALWLLVCTNATVQTCTQLCQATASPILYRWGAFDAVGA